MCHLLRANARIKGRYIYVCGVHGQYDGPVLVHGPPDAPANNQFTTGTTGYLYREDLNVCSARLQWSQAGEASAVRS